MDALIRPLHAADRAATATLLDDAVGAGFWSFSDAGDALQFIAETSAGVAGAVLARLAPADGPDVRTAFASARRRLAGIGEPVLHVRAIAVAPWARRAGLARRLLARVEDEARAAGAPAAFLYAWLPAGQPEPVAVHFYAAAGYRAGPDIAGFYAEGSLAAGARCPACRRLPCRCTARPFVKALPTSA
jgi:ribosomal protein S18 acetylase RimI-like enzyme